MKFWREWLTKLKDPSRDAYERRYRLLALLSILSLIVWWVFSAIYNFQLFRIVFFGLTALVFVGMYLYALRSGRIQLISVISGISLVFGMLPVAFIYNGGVHAGAPNWFIMALVFIVATIRGRSRMVLIIADVIMTALLFLLYATNPQLFRELSAEAGLINSIASLVITATLVSSMLFFQGYIARQELLISMERQREIEELNRAQSNFFSSMSHEIRTPINTIIGMNELVLRDETLPETTVERLESVHSASNMLLSLINDILDMSKMESGKMEIVPVAYETAALLTEVTEMIAERAQKKGLQFHVQTDETLPALLYGDEVRIKQVLVNLLNNAVKYTAEGSVTLSVQGDRLEDPHLIQMTARVEDTGMGIRKEVIPHLFEAFKRVDEEKNRNIEGTGLGLSIVKQIMELMGGEISVSSVYTKGSVFTMSLTQEIVDPTPVGSMASLTRGAEQKREVYRQSFEAPEARLLIVDDNEMNLSVETGLLQDTKINIDTATSGAQALWRTLQLQYDVIFMDHLMPGMDGVECLKQIREQEGGLNRETKVLALTANAGAENRALYAASGFDGYLLKPVSGTQLEEALIRALPEGKVRLTGASTMQSGAEQVFTESGRKRNVVITMDSGGDLPKDLTDRLGIGVINFVLHTRQGAFRDNLEVDSEELMRYLSNPANEARSEVPDTAHYEAFFGRQVVKAQHVIHFTISSDMSKSYNHARWAARSFDNVTVVDSGTVSGGTGLLVLYAAYLAEKDLPVSAILQRVEELQARVHTSFVMDNSEYLLRSGRVSSLLNSLLDAFLLHPVFEFKNMRMKPHVAVFSSYRKQYVRKMMRKYRNPDLSLLFIAYVSLTERELSEIRQEVERFAKFDRIIYVKASSAIAVNCGPGTIGLMFCERGDNDARLFDFLPEEAAREADATETLAPDAPGTRMDSAERLVRHGAETTGSAECPAKPERSGTIGDHGSQAHSLPDSRVHNLPLDTSEALRNCGAQDVLDAALKLFAESAAAKADEIEGFLREEDWENFTIKVHALKSSARLIGATELSAEAEALEALGNTAKNAEA
ncbi:MAG: DegV family EDD domain-containing protein [Lachnospiraceae bacterium]|nr:DegV family EDD domain-containing protein [Lachnospiraceae bacterium]